MDTFKAYIKNEFSDYLKNGYCKKAKEMNLAIGDDYFDIVNPHYFTGNPESKIVMVMLNPQRDKNKYNEPNPFNSFEEYWENYRNYGRNTYGEKNGKLPKWKGKYDLNQKLFLKQLDIIDYVEEEKNDNYIFANLVKTIDCKLQWEFVPFGSPSFNFKHIGIFNLKYFLNKTVEIISLHERKYVFFCGAVFRELLWHESVKIINSHRFKLTKKDGTQTQGDYELIKISIKTEDQEIKAAILPQYAMQGAPLEAYAKKVKELY
jgi:hypothetical protein